MSRDFRWYRCAKRHFSFDRQKKSNQKKTLGYVLILLWVVLLVGSVVAGSALMPIFFAVNGRLCICLSANASYKEKLKIMLTLFCQRRRVLAIDQYIFRHDHGHADIFFLHVVDYFFKDLAGLFIHSLHFVKKHGIHRHIADLFDLFGHLAHG